jgi:hypothetical protein
MQNESVKIKIFTKLMLWCSVINYVGINFVQANWGADSSIASRTEMSYFLYSLIVFLILIFIFNTNVTLSVPKYFVLSYWSLWFSAVLAWYFSPMLFISPLILFYFIKSIESGMPSPLSIVKISFLLYFIIFFPAALILLNFADSILVADSGLLAFSDSRTDYGYIAGLAFLLSVTSRTHLRFIFPILIGICIILSENRASIVAICIALSFYLYFSRERRIIVFIIVALGISLSLFWSLDLSIRGDEYFRDSGERILMLYTGFNVFLGQPFFGSGKFYTPIVLYGNYIVEVHNSIVQSLLNFGLIPSLLWYYMVVKFFQKLGIISKTVLIYWFVFGLFHPGFDAFLLGGETLLVFALCAALNFPIVRPIVRPVLTT